MNDNRPNGNGSSHVIQFVPIAVSATQPINQKGRTICRVVGCSRVDHSYTNGYCKQHYALLHPAPVYSVPKMNHSSGVGNRDYGADWTCVCGETVSAKKKRCWHCSKWRGGAKSKSTSNVPTSKDPIGAVSVPVPKLPPIPGLPQMPGMYPPFISDVQAAVRKRKRLPEPLDTTSRIADIAKVRTAKECVECWNGLFKVRDQRKACNFTQYTNNTEDSFDCSDLVVPSAAEIIEQEAYKAIQRWEDLDTRIALDEEYGDLIDEASADDSLIVDGTMVGDGRKQRLMPPNFDYKCSSTPSDGMDASENANSHAEVPKQKHYRPKVISLMDPTQTLDYETELWHVFRSMPTVTDIERNYGILHEEPNNHGLKHTLRVKNDVTSFLHKHTRIDAHSLGRLRVRDRHSIPYRLTDQSIDNERPSDPKTTIRFEVLRYSENLKRGSSRDSNRLEVELSGSKHTLLDLHRVLVENASISECKIDANTANSIPAGVFFIENQFYTHGLSGEHVVRDILKWFEGNVSNMPAGVSRRKHLCISSPNSCTSMSDICLNELPLRLGIRYVHILVDQPSLLHNKISLKNESAMFVTDIQMHKGGPSIRSTAPIIHDKWTPCKSTPICSACNSAVATVVTLNDELASTLSDGTALCKTCYRSLHYHNTGNDGSEADPSYQSFKALPLDDFNQLSLKNETDKIPDGAIF